MSTSEGFGRTAIITGCASGIGLATTLLFLSHQYKVFGVDISPMDHSKIVEKDQERFYFHRADLLKDGECDEVVKVFVSKCGDKIDVLANVAGVMDAFASGDAYTDKEWDKVIGVNLTVPTRLIRAVLPFMKASKSGSIINVSSIAGTSGAVAGLAYTASKHGLLGVTKHTAWHFRDLGIRCNAVLPGGVETNIRQSVNVESWDQESYSRVTPIHALGYLAGEKAGMAPSNIGNAILFLASNASSAINGVSLPVDYGWSVV